MSGNEQVLDKLIDGIKSLSNNLIAKEIKLLLMDEKVELDPKGIEYSMKALENFRLVIQMKQKDEINLLRKKNEKNLLFLIPKSVHIKFLFPFLDSSELLDLCQVSIFFNSAIKSAPAIKNLSNINKSKTMNVRTSVKESNQTVSKAQYKNKKIVGNSMEDIIAQLEISNNLASNFSEQVKSLSSKLEISQIDTDILKNMVRVEKNINKKLQSKFTSLEKDYIDLKKKYEEKTKEYDKKANDLTLNLASMKALLEQARGEMDSKDMTINLLKKDLRSNFEQIDVLKRQNSKKKLIIQQFIEYFESCQELQKLDIKDLDPEKELTSKNEIEININNK